MLAMISFKNTLPKTNYAMSPSNVILQQKPVNNTAKQQDTLQIGSFKIKKKLAVEIGIAYLIKLIVLTPFIHGDIRKSLRSNSRAFNWICKQGEKVLLPMILPITNYIHSLKGFLGIK